MTGGENERTQEKDEWLNRIRSMEKLDRELFTRKETFYAIKYESEKEIRDISKMVKGSGKTPFRHLRPFRFQCATRLPTILNRPKKAEVGVKRKKFKHIDKEKKLFFISKKYKELNDAKKKRFEGRNIQQIEVDVKYENYHVNEIMDLILPDDTPRYVQRTAVNLGTLPLPDNF